jgi:hypothetical protein
VRWIWKPRPESGGGWGYESPDAMNGLGQRIIDAILGSALPLALNDLGPPSDERLAELARQMAPNVARAIGDGYLMHWDSWEVAQYAGTVTSYEAVVQRPWVSMGRSGHQGHRSIGAFAGARSPGRGQPGTTESFFDNRK